MLRSQDQTVPESSTRCTSVLRRILGPLCRCWGLVAWSLGSGTSRTVSPEEEILDRLASQASTRYTKAEADALFETGSDVAAGLALKRDVATSYSRETLDGFLDSKVAETTYQAGISLKQDKEGSYTSNEVDGLLDGKVAETTYQSGISLKRDKEGSYSSSQVDGLLNGKVANDRVLTDVPANAVFTDTFPPSQSVSYITGLQSQLDGKVANSRVLTDVPADAVFSDTVYTAPGSRPISYITGLQGELNNKAGQSATTSALSFKVDKEGSISESESNANLLARVQTAVRPVGPCSPTLFSMLLPTSLTVPWTLYRLPGSMRP